MDVVNMNVSNLKENLSFLETELTELYREASKNLIDKDKLKAVSEYATALSLLRTSIHKMEMV
jgi:hypothetical protein